MAETERFCSIPAMLRRRAELLAEGRTYIQTVDRYGAWSGFCTFFNAAEQKVRGVAEQPLYLELIGSHELIASLTTRIGLLEDEILRNRKRLGRRGARRHRRRVGVRRLQESL